MQTNDLKPPIVHTSNTQLLVPQTWREWAQLTTRKVKRWRPLTLETMGWIMIQVALIGLVVLAIANARGWV